MKWLDAAWWKGLETLIGLECPADPEGEYRLLRLRKDQHRIHLVHHQTVQGSSNLMAALEKMPKLPIVLALSGEFVMERLLPADAAANPVSAVLGVSVEDATEFDWMVFPASEGRSWVALIRKDALQSYAERLGPHQPRVVAAVFSRAVGMYVLPQVSADFMEANLVLNMGEQEFPFKNGSLATREDLLRTNFTILDEPAVCAALQIPDQNAFLYASLMFAWLQSTRKDASMPLGDRWKEYQAVSQHKQIAVMAALVMGIWFVGLFSIRMQGEQRKAALEEAYSQNLPVLNAIQRLDEKIAAREVLGSKLGSQTLKPSRTSYYLDRIAALVPEEVKLNEMIIGPEEEDQKRQGIREPGNADIVLRGESTRSAPIAAFSEALQSLHAPKGNDSESTGEKIRLTVAKSEMNFQSRNYEFVFLLQLTPSTQEGPSR
jgi:hypothetical protein